MGLRDEYLGNYVAPVSAASAFARDLMRGDPARFKAGYTADNALIAAIEVFALDEVAANNVGAALGVEASKIGGYVERFGPGANRERDLNEAWGV